MWLDVIRFLSTGQAAEAGEQGDEARDGNGEHGLHRPRLQALRILPREGRGVRRWGMVSRHKLQTIACWK